MWPHFFSKFAIAYLPIPILVVSLHQRLDVRARGHDSVILQKTRKLLERDVSISVQVEVIECLVDVEVRVSG
jgi:hypothetical protein